MSFCSRAASTPAGGGGPFPRGSLGFYTMDYAVCQRCLKSTPIHKTSADGAGRRCTDCLFSHHCRDTASSASAPHEGTQFIGSDTESNSMHNRIQQLNIYLGYNVLTGGSHYYYNNANNCYSALNTSGGNGNLFDHPHPATGSTPLSTSAGLSLASKPLPKPLLLPSLAFPLPWVIGLGYVGFDLHVGQKVKVLEPPLLAAALGADMERELAFLSFPDANHTHSFSETLYDTLCTLRLSGSVVVRAPGGSATFPATSALPAATNREFFCSSRFRQVPSSTTERGAKQYAIIALGALAIPQILHQIINIIFDRLHMVPSVVADSGTDGTGAGNAARASKPLKAIKTWFLQGGKNKSKADASAARTGSSAATPTSRDSNANFNAAGGAQSPQPVFSAARPDAVPIDDEPSVRTVLATALSDISRWPPPQPGRHLQLRLLGSTVTALVPHYYSHDILSGIHVWQAISEQQRSQSINTASSGTASGSSSARAAREAKDDAPILRVNNDPIHIDATATDGATPKETSPDAATNEPDRSHQASLRFTPLLLEQPAFRWSGRSHCGNACIKGASGASGGDRGTGSESAAKFYYDKPLYSRHDLVSLIEYTALYQSPETFDWQLLLEGIRSLPGIHYYDFSANVSNFSFESINSNYGVGTDPVEGALAQRPRDINLFSHQCAQLLRLFAGWDGERFLSFDGAPDDRPEASGCYDTTLLQQIKTPSAKHYLLSYLYMLLRGAGDCVLHTLMRKLNVSTDLLLLSPLSMSSARKENHRSSSKCLAGTGHKQTDHDKASNASHHISQVSSESGAHLAPIIQTSVSLSSFSRLLLLSCTSSNAALSHNTMALLSPNLKSCTLPHNYISSSSQHHVIAEKGDELGRGDTTLKGPDDHPDGRIRLGTLAVAAAMGELTDDVRSDHSERSVSLVVSKEADLDADLPEPHLGESDALFPNSLPLATASHAGLGPSTPPTPSQKAAPQAQTMTRQDCGPLYIRIAQYNSQAPLVHRWQTLIRRLLNHDQYYSFTGDHGHSHNSRSCDVGSAFIVEAQNKHLLSLLAVAALITGVGLSVYYPLINDTSFIAQRVCRSASINRRHGSKRQSSIDTNSGNNDPLSFQHTCFYGALDAVEQNAFYPSRDGSLMCSRTASVRSVRRNNLSATSSNSPGPKVHTRADSANVGSPEPAANDTLSRATDDNPRPMTMSALAETCPYISLNTIAETSKHADPVGNGMPGDMTSPDKVPFEPNADTANDGAYPTLSELRREELYHQEYIRYLYQTYFSCPSRKARTISTKGIPHTSSGSSLYNMMTSLQSGTGGDQAVNGANTTSSFKVAAFHYYTSLWPSQAQTAAGPPSLLASFFPAPLSTDVNLARSLGSHLSCLFKLWELLIAGQPLFISTADVGIGANAALAAMTLISPLRYEGVVRPYLTINNIDADNRLVTRSPFRLFYDIYLTEIHRAGSADNAGISCPYALSPYANTEAGQSLYATSQIMLAPFYADDSSTMSVLNANSNNTGGGSTTNFGNFFKDLLGGARDRSASMANSHHFHCAPIILASTNPFFSSLCIDWPHAITFAPRKTQGQLGVRARLKGLSTQPTLSHSPSTSSMATGHAVVLSSNAVPVDELSALSDGSIQGADPDGTMEGERSKVPSECSNSYQYDDVDYYTNVENFREGNEALLKPIDYLADTTFAMSTHSLPAVPPQGIGRNQASQPSNKQGNRILLPLVDDGALLVFDGRSNYKAYSAKNSKRQQIPPTNSFFTSRHFAVKSDKLPQDMPFFLECASTGPIQAGNVELGGRDSSSNFSSALLGDNGSCCAQSPPNNGNSFCSRSPGFSPGHSPQLGHLGALDYQGNSAGPRPVPLGSTTLPNLSYCDYTSPSVAGVIVRRMVSELNDAFLLPIKDYVVGVLRRHRPFFVAPAILLELIGPTAIEAALVARANLGSNISPNSTAGQMIDGSGGNSASKACEDHSASSAHLVFGPSAQDIGVPGSPGAQSLVPPQGNLYPTSGGIPQPRVNPHHLFPLHLVSPLPLERFKSLKDLLSLYHQFLITPTAARWIQELVLAVEREVLIEAESLEDVLVLDPCPQTRYQLLTWLQDRLAMALAEPLHDVILIGALARHLQGVEGLRALLVAQQHEPPASYPNTTE